MKGMGDTGLYDRIVVGVEEKRRRAQAEREISDGVEMRAAARKGRPGRSGGFQ